MKNEVAAALPVRLMGAPGTGKTRLAAALTSALSADKHAAPVFVIEDNPALPLPWPGPPAGMVLLMGLDLPAPEASVDLQQAADRALREALAQSGVNYQVVYGQGEQRLHSALAALQAWLPGARQTGGGDGRRPWVWACDNCSDPQCERRLLTDLLAARTAAP